MSTSRRFCRFSGATSTASFSITQIPEDGLCLSSFVLLTPPGQPGSVLMGRLNPAAPWDHIGALDHDRIVAHGDRWMLPSCHLLYGEGPGEAAQRIAREQLELPEVELQAPVIVSEVYTPKRFPNHNEHWDLEFIYRGKGPAPPVVASAWTELAYLETAKIPLAEIARSHEDVLRSTGFALRE